MSTKLQVLHVQTISKVQVLSWEYMHPDRHRWRVFQINSMRSKSDTVTTLDRINGMLG